MNTARLASVAVTLLWSASTLAQPSPGTQAAARDAAPTWEFAVSGYGYFVPHDMDYGSATATADRSWTHVEARYNYEGLHTGSLWFGANFSFGETLKLDLTPMVGGVFGDTKGVAPGYHLTLGYKKLELYSEGEYLFDTNSHESNFFYAWSELTYAPLEWLRAGLVSQRTRAYKTPLDVQRGILVRAQVQNWTFGVYIFNFGWTEPTTVASVSVEF
jgi:hypothetical protein